MTHDTQLWILTLLRAGGVLMARENPWNDRL